MDITVDNLPFVLGSPLSQLPTVFTQLFEKLLEPDQDAIFMRNYVGAIKQRFSRDQRDPGRLGYDAFAHAAVEAGIVPTMMTITVSTREEQGVIIAASNALEIFIQLSRFGSMVEKRELLDELLEHDFLEVLLDKMTNHRYHFHRQLATALARSLFTENFLAEHLNAEEAAETMTKLCQWCLSGTQRVVAEMQDPETTWSSQMFMGATSIPMRISAAYAPRHFAMGQENVLMAISGILNQVPQVSKRFILEVLQHNPEIVDLLFQCAIEPRNPWYPETEVDSIACEALVNLFSFPLGRIPGVLVNMDEGEIKEEEKAEVHAALDALRLLVSRPHWASKILAVWKKLDEEKWPKVKRLFDNVTRDYSAQHPPDAESFRAIFEYRGTSRISVLRLIANVALVPELLTDADVLLLLRVAYLGSQKIKSADDVDWQNDEDVYDFIEHHQEVFRSPMWTVTLREAEQKTIHSPSVIPGESILGPTSLLRLLHVLSERRLLDQIQSWATIPPELPSSLSVKQLKQMTDPGITKKLLSLALKRGIREIERGHVRLRDEKDVDHARAAYIASAELLASVVTFLSSPQVENRTKVLLLANTQRELVSALGLAADMSNRFGQHAVGYKFALGAVEGGREARLEEEVRGRNSKRLKVAKQALGL